MKMRNPTVLLLVAALLWLPVTAPLAAGTEHNCFTVLVGRKASATGAVLLAHNEDDHPPQIVNLMKVPHLSHPPGELVHLTSGLTLPQVPETAAYVWLEMPGQQFADCFMNEYGVTIVSNQCSSRVPRSSLENAGMGYWLRRLVAERAHTAREAVEIAGRLIQRLGYRSPGRTYSIADPREAWMLAVPGGRQWLAARIPDDQVAVLPNRFTIGEVDLPDASRFLASPGLVDFASRQGWFDPGGGRPFDFAAAYGARDATVGLHSIPRHWFGVTFLSGRTWNARRDLPFSFRPAHPVALEDLFSLLRSHFENTQFETPRAFNHGNPHANAVKRICSESTQYGMVAELRPWLPPALGCVLWWAPRRPCIQPFVPLYSGVTAFPEGFARTDWRRAGIEHFREDPGRYRPDPTLAYWSFAGRAAAVDRDYGRRILQERSRRDRLEGAALAARRRFEASLPDSGSGGAEALAERLTAFTTRWLRRLWELNRGAAPSAGAEESPAEPALIVPEPTPPGAATCTGAP